jgi:hypothetical protein
MVHWWVLVHYRPSEGSTRAMVTQCYYGFYNSSCSWAKVRNVLGYVLRPWLVLKFLARFSLAQIFVRI